MPSPTNMMCILRYVHILFTYSKTVFNENGETIFTVEGKPSWGHKLHILNRCGEHIATVKQVVLTWLPKFELYEGDRYIGSITKKLTFLKPQYEVDFNGWNVTGNFLEWDYNISDRCSGQ